MSKEPSPPKSDPDRIIGKTSKQATEATESDLWDLDSDDSEFAEPAVSTPGGSAGLPSRRASSGSSVKSQKPTDRQTKPLTVADSPSQEVESEPMPADAAPSIGKSSQAESDPGSENWEETADSKTTQPLPVIPILASLSKIEKIAISSLVAVLALAATLSFLHFSNRVPTRPLVAEEIDYPVSGKIVEITAASTYWREPIQTGENRDVVRRGTQLIPVLKLSLRSSSGAIRVFFRNEDGLVVGDGITRTVKGDADITIAATAGFEDLGMHTAYRTGDTSPWKVQVFEAPDATSPREKFLKVLETEISTLTR